jgi:HSP20 family protein
MTMKLMRWPSPLQEIEDMFERTSRSLGLGDQTLASVQEWSPRVDILENDSGYEIRADLPGVTRDDLRVTVTENVLTLEGERREESREDQERFHRVERFHGTFRRSFTLPDGVDTDGLRATVRDGQVVISLPKRQPAPRPEPVTVPIE